MNYLRIPSQVIHMRHTHQEPTISAKKFFFVAVIHKQVKVRNLQLKPNPFY